MSILARLGLVLTLLASFAAPGCTQGRAVPCSPGTVEVAGICVRRCGGGFCDSDGAVVDVQVDVAGLDIPTIDAGPDDVVVTDIGMESSSDTGPGCASPRTMCESACVDTSSDRANCGACGRACPGDMNGSVACVGGACRVTCATGFADCDGDVTNGCEVELATSVDHCGTCGTRCAGAANATAACVAGVCRINCAEGFADCNMMTSDGCETGTDSNVMNCGGCGVVCPGPYQHTERTCVSGACGYRCLNPDWPYEQWTDCDGYEESGCEADLASSCSNCGLCGHACHGTMLYCGEGNCQVNYLEPDVTSCPP